MAKKHMHDLALAKGWITHDQFRGAHSILSEGDGRPLELIYYHKGWINEAQLMELVQERLKKTKGLNSREKALLEDLIYLNLAVKRKWISRPKSLSIFRYELELYSEGRDKRFLEICLFEGWINPKQKEELEKELASSLYICPHCTQLISIARYQGEGKFPCPRCKALFYLSKKNQTVRTVNVTHFSLPQRKTQIPGDSSKTSFRYEILKQIGQGGIGAIYAVYDHDLKRKVALKVVRADKNYTEKTIRRFIREARILAKLEHPNIMPIHEIGYTSDDRLYFTMKYVKGTSLHEVMDRLRKGDEDMLEEFSLEKLLTIFLSICQGVIFAHAHGIIHRDLKPANVMLGPFGEVLVMDWGLAKELKEDSISPYGDMMDMDGRELASAEGRMVGTVHYIPPEQITNREGEVDEKSDIYALGAMLYELLSFRPPFVGKDKKVLIQEVLEKEPPRPSKIAKRKVPTELEAICMKALSKKKRDRYPSARDLYADVENFIHHRPVQALPAGPLRRLMKWLQRNRTIFYSILFVLAVLLFLSPLFHTAIKVTLLVAALMGAAIYSLVFYQEGKQEIAALKQKIRKLEKQKEEWQRKR